MTCCGQKRMASKSTTSVQQQLVEKSYTQSSNGTSSNLRLREQKGAAFKVRGPVTGRQYYFSEAQPFQAVDNRDVAGILNSSLFYRVR